MTREKARLQIIQAANRQRLMNPARRVLPLYGPRQLQRAVAVVRNRQLVKPKVLVDAGFKEHGPNYRPGRPEE